MAATVAIRTIAANELEMFALDVLAKVGLPQGEADLIARYVVDADPRGVDGHGVLRLLQYADSVERNEINATPDVQVIQRLGATALVDADGGYGFAPARLAMELAISLVATWGVVLWE